MILVVGIELALLMLVVSRRGRSRSVHALPLVAWALPGLPIGALALARLPDDALAAVVSASVLVALLALRPGRVADGRVPAWSLPLAGLSAGALTTSTGTNGPPLVLHLLRAAASPEETRRTLAYAFLVLDAVGLAALALGGVLELTSSLPLLLVAGLAGQQLGRGLAARLHPERWAATVRALLAVSAIAVAAGALA